MQPMESLKELERRAYRSVFDDGIYDIVFGLLFLTLAWIPTLEALGVSRYAGYAGLIAIAVLGPWLGKRYVTIPRMGSVEFGPRRRSRKRLALLLGGAVIILTLPLILMIGAGSIAGGIGWPLLAVFAAPVIVIAVCGLDSPRIYLYTAFLLAAVLETEFLRSLLGEPISAIVSLGLPGVVIFFVGVTLLSRFIRMHPLPASEAGHVG